LEQALKANVGQPLGGRQSYHMIATYVGAVYGRLGKVDRSGDASFYHLWPGYFLQGYYPRYFDQADPKLGFLAFLDTCLMWDVGSYMFWDGLYHGGVPHANEGCHDTGGNFLGRDGSVTWVDYPWYKREGGD
jgi:hypothetical protein